MGLKFYLNKIVKVDNIEGYSLVALRELKSYYEKFLEDSEGFDPDFPGINFGGKGKSVVKGKTNIESADKQSKENSISLRRTFDNDSSAYSESDPHSLRRNNRR